MVTLSIVQDPLVPQTYGPILVSNTAELPKTKSEIPVIKQDEQSNNSGSIYQEYLIECKNKKEELTFTESDCKRSNTPQACIMEAAEIPVHL